MLSLTAPERSAEQTFVFAWRMLAAGRARCPALQDEIEAAAGPFAPALMSALGVFLVTLGNASRRRLRVNHPVCRHRTLDEEATLALIAAMQSGDRDRVAAHLRWLVLPDRRDAVLTSLAALADLALRANLRVETPLHGTRPSADGRLAMVSAG